MNIIINELDLHLDSYESAKLFHVSVKQGDEKTRYLHIYLYNQGELFPLNDNMIIYLKVKKQDGTYVYRDSTLPEKDISINTKENYISIELIPQIMTTAGIVKCELKIQENAQIISTNSFNIKVNESILSDKELLNTSDYSSCLNAIEETKVIQQEWNKLKEKGFTTQDMGNSNTLGLTKLYNELGVNTDGTMTQSAIKIALEDKADKNHNHVDINEHILEVEKRLNALADSDDITLDQLSEIVAYIKNNKELIDIITTSKVSVSDIINNLESNLVNKPLSASQGKALKDEINTMKQNFQAGVDGVYNAIVTQGTTPSSKSQSDVINSISILSTNKYNNGYKEGYNEAIKNQNTKVYIDNNTTQGEYHLQLVKNNLFVNNWDNFQLPYSPFINGVALVFNNEIHIIGGRPNYSELDADETCLTSHYIYKYNKWYNFETLPFDFYGKGIVYENRIYLYNENNGSVYKSDISGKNWEKIGSTNYHVEGMIILNNKLYLYNNTGLIEPNFNTNIMTNININGLNEYYFMCNDVQKNTAYMLGNGFVAHITSQDLLEKCPYPSTIKYPELTQIIMYNNELHLFSTSEFHEGLHYKLKYIGGMYNDYIWYDLSSGSTPMNTIDKGNLLEYNHEIYYFSDYTMYKAKIIPNISDLLKQYTNIEIGSDELLVGMKTGD